MPQYLQNTQNLILRFKNLALNQFDIFGQLPNFRLMNKAKYNSIAGFLTTIIIGSMTLIYLTNELISMVTQAEPSVVSSEIQVFETQKFALQNDNFTLAVSVTNSAGNSIIGNGIYYNLTISHCVRTRIRDEINGSISVKVNCTLLPIETCNMSHFTTDKQYDYFNRMRLGAMQCINREFLQQNPPHLQGQLNAITFQYIEIHLRTCKNTTEYQQCVSLEEQQDILMSGHYAVYTSDYLMQLNNPQQPYQQIINSEFSGFSASSSKIIKQYYRIIETTSDDGLLFQNIQTQINLKQQEWRESTELYNGNYIIDHYIALDYRQTDYSRTYIKIQTVLSRLGGIWQIFIIIVATIIRPFINNLMNLEIANQLFRFKFDNNVCLTNMDSEPQKFEDKINMPLITQLPNDLKSQLQIIFGIKNNHKKLFNQAKNIIMEHLDMITIIKKFQQIDILKQILLTNEQQNLLEIIPKPLISLQKQSEITNNIQFINHINQSSNIQNSYIDSYQKMIQSKNIIDERLINLLDRQMLNMFEKSIGIPNISKTPGIESKFEDINEPIPLLPK